MEYHSLARQSLFFEYNSFEGPHFPGFRIAVIRDDQLAAYYDCAVVSSFRFAQVHEYGDGVVFVVASEDSFVCKNLRMVGKERREISLRGFLM